MVQETLGDVARVRSFIEDVDREVQMLAGISVHDLPDVDFASMLDDEYTPHEAAVEILEDEGYKF